MEIPNKIRRKNSVRKSLGRVLMGASSKIRGLDEELATIQPVSTTRYLSGEKETVLQAVAEGKRPLGADLVEDLVVSRGGLLTRDFRQRIWPLLLGVKEKTYDLKDLDPSQNIQNELKTMKNDVARSLSHLNTTEFDLSGDIEMYRDKLYKLMIRHFHQGNTLHYYQGFHDVATVHLLTCGEELGTLTLQQQSQLMLKDYHAKAMEPTVRVTEALYVILEKVDKKVCQKLRKAQVKPLFALSWLITGFAHDLTNFDTICRLYDAFLAFHPLFPVYTSVALVISPKFRTQLLKIGNDSAEMHHFLQSLPKATETMREKFSYDRLLEAAVGIMKTFPPDTVIGRVKDLSKDSMLYTPYPFKLP